MNACTTKSDTDTHFSGRRTNTLLHLTPRSCPTASGYANLGKRAFSEANSETEAGCGAMGILSPDIEVCLLRVEARMVEGE